MKVCFSGTFNILHKGHKHLIDKAIEAAGEKGTLYIGITDGEILKNKEFTIPVNERINIIKKYLKSKDYDKQTIIKIIYDEFGPAVNEDYDAIIVSPETIKNAEELNKKRINTGKKPLKLIIIPHVLADDNKPISSTRIYNKEIDKKGKV